MKYALFALLLILVVACQPQHVAEPESLQTMPATEPTEAPTTTLPLEEQEAEPALDETEEVPDVAIDMQTEAVISSGELQTANEKIAVVDQWFGTLDAEEEIDLEGFS